MMKQLELHFRNGQTLIVDATDVTTTRRGEDLIGLEWVTPERDKRRKLMFIDPTEVTAVVAIR